MTDRVRMALATPAAGVPATESRARPQRRHGWRATCLLLILFGASLVLAILIAPRVIGALDIPLLHVGGPTAPPAALALGPTWTPTPTRTVQPPTPTPSPTGTLAPEQIEIALQGEIQAAEDLRMACDYEQAVEAWDGILRQLPAYAPGYHRRAQSYLGLTHGERILETALDNAYRALEDVDTAIALGEDGIGDYYLTRYDVHSQLASFDASWADPRPQLVEGLEDLMSAISLGNSDPTSQRSLAFELATLGQCAEALAQAEYLASRIEPGDPPSAGIENALANAYICSGDYSQAVSHLDAAIQIHDIAERRYLRAVVHYGLGRLTEALEFLDASIEAQPGFYGYRYYFRALIDYDLGLRDQAEEDLQTGVPNTWGRGGAAALVAALFARDAGNRETAIARLRLAEVTTGYAYRPILDRIRAELVALGETPIPDGPVPLSQGVPAPVSGQSPAGPSPATPPAQEASYKSGTGPFGLCQYDHQAFYFRPDSPLLVGGVRSLTIRPAPRAAALGTDLAFFVWNPQIGFWTMFNWEGGDIPVTNPGRFVSPNGEVFVAVSNAYDDGVWLDDITLRLEVELADGSVALLGPPAQ